MIISPSNVYKAIDYLHLDRSWLYKKVRVKRTWKKTFGTELNLEDPKTFNEKLQWLKLYGKKHKELYAGDIGLAQRCADKLLVRDYVKDCIGSQHLNKLLGTYNNVKSIDFGSLPDRFVIKANHDSGSTIIVRDKKCIDKSKLKRISQSLRVNYGYFSQEWVYENIQSKIIVEEYLDDGQPNGLWDYKIHCFGGEPKLVQVDVDRFVNHKRYFYDASWNKIDLAVLYPTDSFAVPKPELLEEALEKSRVLSHGFCYVRVDWYMVGKRLVFGEMTFFHGSGFEHFSKKEWEFRMGSWIDIPV